MFNGKVFDRIQLLSSVFKCPLYAVQEAIEQSPETIQQFCQINHIPLDYFDNEDLIQEIYDRGLNNFVNMKRSYLSDEELIEEIYYRGLDDEFHQ